jgi:pre-rRNA-processing protein TSR1
VAPKVVALLGLGEDCDTAEVRQALVYHCIEYSESLKSKKTRKEANEVIESEGMSQFKAYLCPNPGSSTNMISKKQRLIFLEIDRNSPYSVMDVAKVADMVLCVMSCRRTNVQNVKQDPFQHAKAIDEIGYRALSLIRSQGMPSLIGVLQHLEHQSSSKHSQVKRLFQRIFESEFTDKCKFMSINKTTDSLLQTDSNALLRQIAVNYPEEITWRQKRSYMLGEVVHTRMDEVHIKGYIR